MSIKDKKCIDCDALIFRGSTRCYSCAQKERFNRNDIWNKGTKGVMKPNKTSFVKNDPRITEENAYQWKGDMVGYKNLHNWVYKNLGKAVWCSHCMSTVTVQWANVSHEYKRDLNDWMQLCVKCHKKYDKNAGKGHSKKYFENGRRIAVSL